MSESDRAERYVLLGLHRYVLLTYHGNIRRYVVRNDISFNQSNPSVPPSHFSSTEFKHIQTHSGGAAKKSGRYPWNDSFYPSLPHTRTALVCRSHVFQGHQFVGSSAGVYKVTFKLTPRRPQPEKVICYAARRSVHILCYLMPP